MFALVHFGESQLEGKRGLGTLVFAHAIGMETVAAPTGVEIVESHAEIVASGEDGERL